MQIINITQGTTLTADYTIPSLTKQYRSSKEIFNSILNFEEERSLEGVILLVHIGTHPERKDKLYNRLDELIMELKSRGYEFQLIHM